MEWETNGRYEFIAFFAVEAEVPGHVHNQAGKKIEKCYPAGTGTKIYLSSNSALATGLVETNLEVSETRFFKCHFGASNMALTKARLLKHDLPIHRKTRLAFPLSVSIFIAELKLSAWPCLQMHVVKSRFEVIFEILFETAGAKLWKGASEELLGN